VIARKTGTMRKGSFELVTALALTLGSILALTLEVRANDVAVTGAFARASAMQSARSAAVYLTLQNSGPDADTLFGISTDAADMAMLHRTEIKDGVAKMTMSGDISIPGGGTLEFNPSGSHIMLEGLKAPLKQGTVLTLTLKFKKAGDVLVTVPVAGVAAMAP
jgi:periplasmic copper chaperone A